MSVAKTTTGLGLIGVTLCIMAVFGVLTLAVVFLYHSALSGVYAISEQTHIPFLALLAMPFGVILIIGLLVDGIRWLLKHVSRS